MSDEPLSESSRVSALEHLNEFDLVIWNPFEKFYGDHPIDNALWEAYICLKLTDLTTPCLKAMSDYPEYGRWTAKVLEEVNTVLLERAIGLSVV